MAPRNLEIIRAIYERWGRGDFTAGSERFTEETTLVMRPEFPESGTYEGPEGIRRYTLGFLESFDGATITGESFEAEGDSVVVGVRQQGTGRGSGIPSEMRFFHVWTFRGEEVLRIDVIMSRADALAAAGLGDGA